MNEKTKLWTHRIIWIVIVAFIIFLPILINASKPELELVDDTASSEYLSGLDESSIDMTLTFNRPVNSGYATIKYYDSSDHLLETDREYFTAYGTKTAESFLIYIDGDVDSYEIVSFEFEPTYEAGWMFAFLPFAIIFLIASLLLSYKEYDYNGKKLSVYAGWFHHTLRVNGEKCDEHSTLLYFTPIKLSTTLDDETKLEATITLTNRITLKANDKLLNK